MPIAIECPDCGSKLSAADKHAGREFPCPKCKSQLRVPHSVSQEIFDEHDVTKVPPVVDSTAKKRSGVLYPWCRILRVATIRLAAVSFLLSILAIVLLVVRISEGAFANVIITISILVVSFAIGGLVQLAFSELLGGIVAYLIKHGCSDQID